MTRARLYQRLDHPIHPNYKPRHNKALIKLCRTAELYPECFLLNVENIEKNYVPIAGGGYGDVYRCRFKGQLVAVKALKFGRDNDRFLKVGRIYGFDRPQLIVPAGFCVRSGDLAAIGSSKYFTILWCLYRRKPTQGLHGIPLVGRWKCCRVSEAQSRHGLRATCKR